MRTTLLFVCLLFCRGSVNAQTPDEIRQKILGYQKCYNSWSIPLSDTKSTIRGTEVSYSQNINYETATFLIADKDAEPTLPATIEQINIEYSKQGKSFHILSHGLIDQYLASTNAVRIGGYAFKAEDMAELILEKMRKYEILLKTKNEPFTIVIHSCKADIFAQQLSAILAGKISDVAVVAAPDLIYPRMIDGKYTETISPTSLQLEHLDFKGENWIVFKEGKVYMEGTPDYNETVGKYHSRQRKIILQRVADKYRQAQ